MFVGQFEMLLREVGGHRIATVVGRIPRDGPPGVREGLRRRRLLAAGYPCPCGAQPLDPAGIGPGMHVADTEHTDTCPAADAVLLPATRAWHAGRSRK